MIGKTDPKLACLLMAAGASKRLGKPKQLIEYKGETLVLRAARLLLTQSPNVVVVTGACAAGVGRQLNNLPVRIKRNEHWPSGMGGSIAKGMGMIDDDIDAVMIMLCDQWKIDQADLRTLKQAWLEDPARIVTSAWNNSLGPPAIISAQYFSELRHLHGEQGAKKLLDDKSQICRVDTPNARFDLDTEEDLQAMLVCLETKQKQ